MRKKIKVLKKWTFRAFVDRNRLRFERSQAFVVGYSLSWLFMVFYAMNKGWGLLNPSLWGAQVARLLAIVMIALTILPFLIRHLVGGFPGGNWIKIVFRYVVTIGLIIALINSSQFRGLFNGVSTPDKQTPPAVTTQAAAATQPATTPAATEPTTQAAAATQPATTPAAATTPPATTPAATEPTTQAAAAEKTVDQSVASQSADSQSADIDIQTAATTPAATTPAATEPTTQAAAATQSETTQAASTQATATQSETTQAAASQSTSTQAAITKPTSTQATATRSETTQAAITKPASSVVDDDGNGNGTVVTETRGPSTGEPVNGPGLVESAVSDQGYEGIVPSGGE